MHLIMKPEYHCDSTQDRPCLITQISPKVLS